MRIEEAVRLSGSGALQNNLDASFIRDASLSRPKFRNVAEWICFWRVRKLVILCGGDGTERRQAFKAAISHCPY
jgi:hypothetical protein